jgi:hypothetical protein
MLPLITQANEVQDKRSQQYNVMMAAESTNKSDLFRRPSFNKEKSLEEARQWLRKQGHYHAGLIDMLAREKVDRNWGAQEVRADKYNAAGDYFSAAKTYDKILASLHPDHLTARYHILKQKYFAYRNFGYVGSRLAKVEDELRSVRKQVCTIEAEGYRRLKGNTNQARYQGALSCLKALRESDPYHKVKPVKKDRCDKSNLARLSEDAKSFFNLACKHNYSYSRATNYPYTDLAYYIKDEDGNVTLLRTGYEVELYKALKDRYMNKEIFRPLPISHLFTEAVFATLHRKRGDNDKRHVVINVLDTLLTAHNVTRLLARPEQWSANYPKTHAGQNRNKQDSARPIFEDLMGVRSVDQYPTFLDYYDYKGRRYFDYHKVIDAFFGKKAVFDYIDQASAADDGFTSDHWNGGIHYYFWVGALAQWLGNETSSGTGGGFAATSGAYVYEFLQKHIQFVGLRGRTQLNYGFVPGKRTINRFIAVLEELEQIDPSFVTR